MPQVRINLFVFFLTLELLEEIQSALQLKANLSVELEALQQIRSELEDSECMSEVHFRLERATENNRRLHAALQAADEQSKSFFWKSHLESVKIIRDSSSFQIKDLC